jgi:hypothetical protein
VAHRRAFPPSKLRKKPSPDRPSATSEPGGSARDEQLHALRRIGGGEQAGDFGPKRVDRGRVALGAGQLRRSQRRLNPKWGSAIGDGECELSGPRLSRRGVGRDLLEFLA